MFVVTVLFTVAPEHIVQFLAEVTRNAALSVKLEPGCRRFDVCHTDTRPSEVFLYEVYDDDAAFAAHKTMDHYAAFSKAVGPMVTAKDVRTFARLKTPII